MDNNDLNNRLHIVGSRTKDYKSHPDDTTYYRLHIQPYQIKKCKECGTVLKPSRKTDNSYAYHCSKCRRYVPETQMWLGNWKRNYSQETVKDGNVTKGSKGINKVIYNRNAVSKSQRIIFCTSENDCDFLSSIGVVATTVIGYGKHKFLSKLWSYYREDFRGKDMLFIARSDAEEKQMLMLIRDQVMAVAKTVRIFNLCREVRKQQPLERMLKYRIRTIYRAESDKYFNDAFDQLAPNNEYYIKNQIERLEQRFTPTDYMDGYADIELLKPKQEIATAKLAIEKHDRLVEKQAKKYAADKRKEKQLMKKHSDKVLLAEILVAIRKHFPVDKKQWKTPAINLCETLNSDGFELSPKKLMLLLAGEKVVLKKAMGKGRTLLTLSCPKAEEAVSLPEQMG